MFSFDDIRDYNKILPPRILLYSPHGIGKTTFGANAIKPIFAMTEKGLGNMQGVQAFPFIDTYQKMVDAITFLFGEHPFKTLVIDSADWLEPLIWQAVCQEYDGKNSIEDFGYGKGYKFAIEKWSMLLSGLTALQEQRGMSIVILAHSEVKRFDSPESEPFDRYRPKLHELASAKIQEWADIVLFGNYRTTVKKEDVGFKKTVRRGEGAGERVLYTEERPAFYAKNRYKLPPAIPFPETGAHKMIIDWVLKGVQIQQPDSVGEQPQQPEQAQPATQQEQPAQQQAAVGMWPDTTDDKEPPF